MNLEDFPDLYYCYPDKELAKMFGVKSVNTIASYAKKIGLELKGKRYMYENDRRKLSKIEREN